MRKIKTNQNKKAISEMVSYVLMIVIALGLAVGVYSWLKIYVTPSSNEADTCSTDIAIALNDYSCSLDPTNGKVISLELENKGYFNIAGFFIKANNITGNLPAIYGLSTIDYDPRTVTPGRYDFALILNEAFGPGKVTTAKFKFNELDSIKKIYIQPFIVGEKSHLLVACPNKVEINLNNCDGSSLAPPAQTTCPTSPVSTALPVAWWKFENDASDCWGSNDGEVIGSVNYASGHKNLGVKFNGTNGNLIRIPNSADIQFGTNDFTISFWAKLVNDTLGITLYKWDTAGSGRWLIGIDNKKIVFSDDNGPSLSTDINTDAGNWQNIIFERNGNNLLSFVNGANIQQESNYFSGANLNNPIDLKFGCDGAGQTCLNGTLDEVMIFNKALNQTEVNELYSSPY